MTDLPTDAIGNVIDWGLENHWRLPTTFVVAIEKSAVQLQALVDELKEIKAERQILWNALSATEAREIAKDARIDELMDRNRELVSSKADLQKRLSKSQEYKTGKWGDY
jgi:hypothetical protein